MILIALGANLATERHGTPREGLEAALRRLAGAGLRIVRRSRWYRSAPVPAADQPDYVNGVARVETRLSAPALMALLLDIEAEFGRQRGAANAARVLDLDLIDYNGVIADKAADATGPALQLPHPRLAERAFVLLPLAEIAPDWRDPRNGRPIGQLVDALPEDQEIALLED
jgi:2-amino-4-hydroxy-6-hydroxymethyldihydropteridine diphosphokinase